MARRLSNTALSLLTRPAFTDKASLGYSRRDSNPYTPSRGRTSHWPPLCYESFEKPCRRQDSNLQRIFPGLLCQLSYVGMLPVFQGCQRIPTFTPSEPVNLQQLREENPKGLVSPLGSCAKRRHIPSASSMCPQTHTPIICSALGVARAGIGLSPIHCPFHGRPLNAGVRDITFISVYLPPPHTFLRLIAPEMVGLPLLRSYYAPDLHGWHFCRCCNSARAWDSHPCTVQLRSESQPYGR